MLTIEIKKALLEKGITITDLAEKIGITRGWASSIINGHNDSPRTLARILKALGIKKPKKEDSRHGKKTH